MGVFSLPNRVMSQSLESGSPMSVCYRGTAMRVIGGAGLGDDRPGAADGDSRGCGCVAADHCGGGDHARYSAAVGRGPGRNVMGTARQLSL
jgi:hypothetical protein